MISQLPPGPTADHAGRGFAIAWLLVTCQLVGGARATAQDVPRIAATSPQTANPIIRQVAGRTILEDAASKISSYPAIVAKIRLQIDMLDQHMVGSGMYQETDYVDDRLMRVEMKVAVASGVASFQRISDGRYVWTRQDLPNAAGELSPIVSRIDLERVAEALSADQWRSRTVADGSKIPIGSIAFTLYELGRTFDFPQAEPIRHQGVPALLVRGDVNDRNAARRKAAMPAGFFVPDSVTVVLGRDDMFPYLIQYDRRGRGRGEGGQAAPLVVAATDRPILTVEFFQVELPPAIDPRRFIYQPGDLAIQDTTDEYIRRWKPPIVP